MISGESMSVIRTKALTRLRATEGLCGGLRPPAPPTRASPWTHYILCRTRAYEAIGFQGRSPWRGCGRRSPRTSASALPRAVRALSRCWEYRLGVGKRGRKDEFDVATLDLRIHRSGSGILSVLELGRPIGHDVIGKRRRRQRLDDLGTVCGLRAFDRIGEETHGRIVQRRVVQPEASAFLRRLAHR